MNTKTYSCLSHVVDADEAMYELDKMVEKAPVIDLKIVNFHHESRLNRETGKRTEVRINTGGESKRFHINKWTDSSSSTGFLKNFGKDGCSLARISISENIEWSP